ncbi:hypothetical protein HOLleu_40796 [Holothuria leucospilota]|uniref:Uncharacterized protein n=1 Tax=Holothuria leucospilota TaxID=206669 RepID=A0A9Q0YGJ2_HOLLE|nr:hypothetical protein HOLleu_40796 [Holothuria leucospilota]
MTGCPASWPLEVINITNRLPAQICRSSKGDGQWRCAQGWTKLHNHPYCVPSFQGLTGSGRELEDGILSRSYVSDKRKLLLVNIPPSDLNFIKESFLFDDRKFEPVSQHKFQEYHKFTVVRHPCARLVSAWNMYLQNDGGNLYVSQSKYFEKPTFEVFVMVMLSAKRNAPSRDLANWPSQTSVLFDKEGHFLLDQLLIAEKWDESVDELGHRIHADTSSFKLNNIFTSTSTPDLCKDMFSKDSWSKMLSLYSLDLCTFGYSRELSKIEVHPTSILKPHALNARYQKCKETLIQSSEDSCNIYTYYQPTSEDQNVRRQFQILLDVWKNAWSEAGWNPHILSEKDARTHPEYQALRQKFLSLPTVNNKEYEVACFMRHVAMAAVGGGWMADFDTLPLHIPKCVSPPSGGAFTTWDNFIPCLVSGSAKEFTRLAHMMGDIDWKSHPEMFAYSGKQQVSDMLALELFAKQGKIKSFKAVSEAYEMLKPFMTCNVFFPDPKVLNNNQLPLAVHFSHESLHMLTNYLKTKSPLWPGSTWTAELLEISNPETRSGFITDAHKFLSQRCKKRK